MTEYTLRVVNWTHKSRWIHWYGDKQLKEVTEWITSTVIAVIIILAWPLSQPLKCPLRGWANWPIAMTVSRGFHQGQNVSLSDNTWFRHGWQKHWIFWLIVWNGIILWNNSGVGTQHIYIRHEALCLEFGYGVALNFVDVCSSIQLWYNMRI